MNLIKLISIFGMLLFFGPLELLSQSCVSEYQFEDCNGVGNTTDVLSGYNGTLEGNAYISAMGDGKIGRSIVLDGDEDWVSVPSNPDLQITGDLTLYAWIYINSYQTAGIVTKGSPNAEYWLAVRSNGHLYYGDAATPRTESTGTVPSGGWHHVAYVRETTGNNHVGTFYIDGAVAGTINYSGSIGSYNLDVNIGACDPCHDYLDGRIDEVKICAYAADASEVNTTYTNENAGLNADGTQRCPSACNLTGAGESNEDCNDNGTGNDSGDDYITFDLDPSGTDLGATYSVTANNGATVTLIGGGAATGISYGSSTSFRLQNGSSNGTNYTITVTDVDDASCQVTTTVMQNSCSVPACTMDAPTITTECDDNGTPADSNDDTFSYTITVTGTGTAATYSITGDDTRNGLSYSTAQGPFGPFNISSGDLTITITDDTDGTCQQTNVTVTAPTTCSSCPPPTCLPVQVIKD